MNEEKKTLLVRFKRLFPLKTFLRYLVLVIVVYYVISGFLFSQSTQNASTKYRDIRDRFYENTIATNLRDDIFSSQIYAFLITIFIVFPVLFLADLIIRRKTLSSLLLFPMIFVSTLLLISLTNGLFSKVLNIYLGPKVYNKDIVKLEKIWIESVDSNNNRKPDTLRVYLTINGDDPRNKTSYGKIAFGGVKICIYSPSYFSQSLTCEHFFHAENQDELKQERLQIGMKGVNTYSFSVETPLDTNLKPYQSLKELRVTANFIGEDAPLVFYDTKIPNNIDFANFENIGIRKLPNEGGLH